MVWPGYKLDKLQQVHSIAIACRIMCRIPKTAHITEHMKGLPLATNHYAHQFKVLLLTFRAYNDMAPAYLCDLVKHMSQVDQVCDLKHNARLERTVTRLKTYGDKSFQYAVINEWHSLPLSI